MAGLGKIIFSFFSNKSINDVVYMTDTGQKVAAVQSTALDANGNPTPTDPAWDLITPNYTGLTSDVYVYSKGGSTVMTITLNYTDSTKETYTTITKVLA